MRDSIWEIQVNDNKYPEPSRWREELIEEGLAPAGSFICPRVGGDPEKDNHYVLVPWPGPDDADDDSLVLFEGQAIHTMGIETSVPAPMG